MSSFLRLCSLVLLGGFAGLAVVEGTLQIGARMVGHDLARPKIGGGEAVVLMVGDSNTYGLFVAREEAYPSVLERLWREGRRQPPLRVANLGYPGTNSTLLASQWADLLAELQPRVVSILVGVNDFWTVPMQAKRDLTLPERVTRFLWQHVRTVRLVYFWWRERSLLEVEVPEDFRALGREHFYPRWQAKARVGSRTVELGYAMEGRPGEVGSERIRTLEKNLATMVRAAQRSGACVLLLTYPSEGGLYGLANRVIRTVAEGEKVRLVDLGELFAPSCPLVGTPSLVASRSDCPDDLLPDQHPTARGHEKIARLLLDPVSSCLR